MGKRPPSPTSDDVEAGHGAHRHQRHHRTRPPPPPPPRSWFPWLVPLIFVANVSMFVYEMYVNDCPANNVDDECLFVEYLGRFSFQPFQQNPLLGPSTNALRSLGALEKDLVVDYHEVWRLFTCIFLHAGVIHLFANMFSLMFIGVSLEKEFGFLRIGLLYVLSGFGGSLLSILQLKPTAKPSISVGASGALFGLLGSMLSELLTNWSIYANKCAALTTLVLVIGLNLAVGFLPRVDSSAHIGGFLSGYFLGFVLLMRPQYGYVSSKYIPAGYDPKHKSKYKWYQYFFLVTSLIILLLGYAYAIARLFMERQVESFYWPERFPR